MYKYLLVVLICFALPPAAMAQAPAGVIDGAVRDSVSGNMLEEATVSLLVSRRESTDRIFAVRRNGSRGFAFRGLAAGDYMIVSTYLGYRPDTMWIRLAEKQTAGARVLLRMQRSDNPMMQVVVTAHIPPVIVRHDTIAFNTAAYPTQPHATLEDLLRKLPGIDVDQNGNVTMQGKKVDKVYLDGKEFFLGDPRTATQNLPADIIDQVQAFDSKTDRERLTGIKDMTNTTSLNIKLKKNRRKGIFGKLYAGAGTGAAKPIGSGSSIGSGSANGSGSPVGAGSSGADPSYSVGGTVMTLGKTTLMARGYVNNMNNQFTGTENRNGPGAAGVQTLNKLDLNFRREIGKVSITLNGGTDGHHTILDQLTTTQTTLTDSSLLTSRNMRSVTTDQNWHTDAFAQYKPDAFHLLEFRSGISGSSNDNDETDSTNVATLKGAGGYPVNNGQTLNRGHSTNISVNNSLNFRQTWRKPGRTLLIGLSQNSSRQEQPQTTYSLVNNYDSTGMLRSRTLIDQAIRQTSGSDGYGAQVTYTEPLKKGHLLDWDYTFNRTIGRNDRTSMDYDSLTGSYDLPDAVTTNHFTNTNTIQRLGMGYNATVGKYQYQIGIAGQFSELDNANRTNDSVLRLRQTNWYPRASLIYSSGSGRSLNLQYSAATKSPTLQELQPVADPTNPFLIRVGNPDLKQELTHRLGASYNIFNTHSFRNLQLHLDGTYSQNAIVSSTTIMAGGIQQQESVNTNGVWNVSGNLNYGFPLGDQKKGNGSIGLNGRYGRGVSIVNGVQDITFSPGAGATGKLNFHPVEELFVEAQGMVGFTASHYSANPLQKTGAWTQHYSLQASYLFPGAVGLSTFYSLRLTTGSLPAPPVSVWNASAYKDIGRRRDFQLRLSAFGLLNNTRNTSQSMSPGVLSTTQTNIPGRIFLLSLVWHFKQFQGGSEAAEAK